MVGAVLETEAHTKLLVVSAYMPSGLDHAGGRSDKHALAAQLYAEIEQWSLDCQHTLVLGDLNETRDQQDRWPRAAPAHTAAHSKALNALALAGYCDVYRALCPRTPGHTHRVVSALRPSSSRIDYIWAKGYRQEDFERVQIDWTLRALTHHALLWADLTPPRHHHHGAAAAATALPATSTAKPYQRRMPNLRAATDAQRERFVRTLETQLAGVSLPADADEKALDALTERLTFLARTTAFDIFPILGDEPFASRELLRLQRQRQSLSCLLTLSHTLLARFPAARLPSSPEWCRKLQRCTEHQVLWSTHPSHTAAWLDETCTLLRRARSSIAAEVKRMQRTRPQLRPQPYRNDPPHD